MSTARTTRAQAPRGAASLSSIALPRFFWLRNYTTARLAACFLPHLGSCILRGMQVQVRLYAELARSLGGGERQRTIELPAGSSVGDLLAKLAVPDEIGVIVGRNGQLADRATALAEGDKLELMTAME